MEWETVLSYPWRIMLPEFTILGVATLISLMDLFMREKISRQLLAYISLAGIALAGFFLFWNMGLPVQEILYETFRLDGFANAFKIIFLLGTAFVFLSSLDTVKDKDVAHKGEFYYLILTALLGAMIVASSADIITLFVGLELLSISSYILAGVRKKHIQSNESAMKYIISGSVASAIMLFGISYIYGLTGTTNLGEITELLAQAYISGYEIIVYFAFFVTFVGMSFKISVIPFHMWTPDVYQGAPTPVTSFLSVISKAAGFALIIRFFAVTYWPIMTQYIPSEVDPNVFWVDLSLIIGVVAALSMIVGNVMAVKQTNIKRMFGYSSIAQAGYILVPFALFGNMLFVSPLLHFENVVFYLFVYLFMNLGAFAVIQIVTQDQNTDDIRSFAGLHRRSPWQAAAMTLFLLSLAGLPPAAGFIAKLYILMNAINAQVIWLAIVMMATTVVSYIYYFAVIQQMYLRKPAQERKVRIPIGTGIVLFLCALATLVFFFTPNIAFDFIKQNLDLMEIFQPPAP